MKISTGDVPGLGRCSSTPKHAVHVRPTSSATSPVSARVRRSGRPSSRPVASRRRRTGEGISSAAIRNRREGVSSRTTGGPSTRMSPTRAGGHRPALNPNGGSVRLLLRQDRPHEGRLMARRRWRDRRRRCHSKEPIDRCHRLRGDQVKSDGTGRKAPDHGRRETEQRGPFRRHQRGGGAGVGVRRVRRTSRTRAAAPRSARSFPILRRRSGTSSSTHQTCRRPSRPPG